MKIVLAHADSEPETIEEIGRALRKIGHEVELADVSGPLGRTIAKLESLAPDLIFNAAKSAFLPALFERLNLPFTGSTAYATSLARDKQLTKTMLAARGILTPRWAYIADAKSIAAAASLTFPVTIKPNFEHAAAELTTKEAFKDRATALLAKHPNGLLVEEHVPGRDVAVHYLEKTGLLEPTAELTPDHREQIMMISRLALKTLGVRDVGRIELRVGADGKVYFLEVKALPNLEEIEHAADAVVEAIVKSAAERFNVTAKSRAKKKALRVGFTYNLKRVQSTTNGEIDSDAEYDSPKVIAAVRGAIESYGHEVVELEATPELPAIIGSAGIDVVFNLAEGIRGRNREAQVPAILELLDIPYSGSDAATMSLALDKALAKRVVAQAGIATAPFLLLTTGKERLPKDFRFPAIVKPVAEGSSKGVLKTSVVENEPELRELAKMIVGKYRQAALVETFLPGREFTVALLGEKKPRVLPPMEIVFINKDTKHPVYAFDHKLDWSTELRYDRPASVDAALGKELERVARAVFDALGCRDLARIDLRMDAEGRLNFLEVNPLPGLSPGWSDMCLIAESAGMDYRTLIGEILAPAIRRYREKRSVAR